MRTANHTRNISYSGIQLKSNILVTWIFDNPRLQNSTARTKEVCIKSWSHNTRHQPQVPLGTSTIGNFSCLTCFNAQLNHLHTFLDSFFFYYNRGAGQGVASSSPWNIVLNRDYTHGVQLISFQSPVFCTKTVRRTNKSPVVISLTIEEVDVKWVSLAGNGIQWQHWTSTVYVHVDYSNHYALFIFFFYYYKLINKRKTLVVLCLRKQIWKKGWQRLSNKIWRTEKLPTLWGRSCEDEINWSFLPIVYNVIHFQNLPLKHFINIDWPIKSFLNSRIMINCPQKGKIPCWIFKTQS